LSAVRRERGFKFVGSTICYAVHASRRDGGRSRDWLLPRAPV